MDDSIEDNTMGEKEFKPARNDDKFTTKELNILEKNKRFFSANKKYIDAMLSIINGDNRISIRVLDWFVANYSKKNNIFYKIRVNRKEEFFYVNNEYKNQLYGYSKQYFDPFCRRKKIIYSYKVNDGSDPIIFLSSIGQLNFFQWAIRNQIIKYVEKHLAEIENDMKTIAKISKERKKNTSQMTAEWYNNSSEIDFESPDPEICSSDNIASINISPVEKNNEVQKPMIPKRQKLSVSVYAIGIKKSTAPINLDFE